MTVIGMRGNSANALDIVSEALLRELQRRIERSDIRLVALVDVGDDEILRERLAQACAGIANVVIAVFETTKES
jgi:hypothetical protein